MSAVWGSLDALKAAVQEGVKEFSQASHAALNDLNDVRHNPAREGERVVIDGVSFDVEAAGSNDGSDDDDSNDGSDNGASGKESSVQDARHSQPATAGSSSHAEPSAASANGYAQVPHSSSMNGDVLTARPEVPSTQALSRSSPSSSSSSAPLPSAALPSRPPSTAAPALSCSSAAASVSGNGGEPSLGTTGRHAGVTQSPAPAGRAGGSSVTSRQQAPSSPPHRTSSTAGSASLPQDEPYAFNTRSNGSKASLTGGTQAVAAAAGPAGGTAASVADLGSSDDIRRAYVDTKRAYDELKGMLQKSMAECMRLSDDVVRLEGQGRLQQAAVVESCAAAKAAKREAADVAAALATAKRDAAASSRALTKAQEALEQQSHDTAGASDVAELQMLQEQLAQTVRKAAAAIDAREAAEARAAAAEAARAAAEAARLESDSLRRDAQAEAHAAQAVAEAERSNRAEAQGMSETLRQEGERRARVFNNAVKAAVCKVQRELEQQRDDLSHQLRQAHALLEASRTQLGGALEAAEAARAEAEARTADAAAAGHVAGAAESAAERSRVREQEAAAAARVADMARMQAVVEAEELRSTRVQVESAAQAVADDLAATRRELARLHSVGEARTAVLEAELAQQRGRAEAAAAALAAAEVGQAVAGRDLLGASQAEAAASRRRVEELETEVSALQQQQQQQGGAGRGAGSSAASMFALPTKEDVLAGLGLEIWKDDSLRWKTGSADVESASSPAPPPPSSSSRVSPTLRATGGVLAASGRRLAGIVPLRIWLLVAYLSLLHIVVMVSFTHTSEFSKLQACERMGAHAGGGAVAAAVSGAALSSRVGVLPGL